MKTKIFRNIFQTLLVLVLLTFSVQRSFAQTNMTKIKDGTVSGTPNVPVLGAVLELESNNKGFLTPRLTASQRDAIIPANRVDGLLIYNTSTGCFNYWSSVQAVWLSLCGTPPPAVINISTVQCNEVVVNGIYKQGEFLNSNNTLNIPVSVTQAGTYEVSASTNNGYYFSTSGTFPTTGSYMLTLNGVGTPNRGYNTGESGDELTIVLNNRPANCKPFVFVEKASVDFVITCANIQSQGNYYIGMALNDTNKLQVAVNVTSTGFWSINTNVLNGYSFAGTGNFTTIGAHTIELTGTGMPLASGTNQFNLSSNAANASSCSNIPVIVAPVKYTVNCNDAVINGSYMQDVALNSSNTILLKVNVLATGKTTITTNTVSGITFTSGVVSLDNLGEQLITLTGTGTITGATDIILGITGTPGLEAPCNITIPIVAQPVNYAMSCSSITVNGNYAPETPMIATNTMTLNVTVTYPGAYSITTNTVNGISFTATGTFSTTGTQPVTLRASGIPLAGGTFNYVITSNSSSGGTSCTKSITFVYRTMNVLGVGQGLYSPGTASNSEAARAILQNKNSFGPSGKVQIQDMKIFNNGLSQGATLRNNINNNKIDIIVLSYNFLPNAASIEILNDFVKNKKGVLIHSQENSASSTQDLINKISGGSVAVSGTGTTYQNPILNVADPILQGPFEDVRGKAGGSDVNNSYYVSNFPSNLILLATQNGNASRAWMLRHNSLGYVYIGDSGWISGTPSNTSTTIWPAYVTSTGLPLSKSYSGGTVYNSFLYANTIAWAVKYVQENTIVDYTVQ
ncbi:hypothetical protein [Flavobacterium sp. NKUCC04_CG]|uniref:hypothetical protein n=1 Tax=Flavobacterium sp. NKUCC04_CG TaxID=2842121 RepID=UPI001C5BBAE7|nr:hypothetical protein [Flavobacterium sp. NKUCC04_CG]MBW3520372.1 hypothetical protein [Flavobacterium sp. NKUCC04_CG]